jgi:hypothetical protein
VEGERLEERVNVLVALAGTYKLPAAKQEVRVGGCESGSIGELLIKGNGKVVIVSNPEHR